MTKLEFREKHLKMKLEHKILNKKLFDLNNQRFNILKKEDLSPYDIQMISHLDKKIVNIKKRI